jgi:hypothetical protein
VLLAESSAVCAALAAPCSSGVPWTGITGHAPSVAFASTHQGAPRMLMVMGREGRPPLPRGCRPLRCARDPRAPSQPLGGPSRSRPRGISARGSGRRGDDYASAVLVASATRASHHPEALREVIRRQRGQLRVNAVEEGQAWQRTSRRIGLPTQYSAMSGRRRELGGDSGRCEQTGVASRRAFALIGSPGTLLLHERAQRRRRNHAPR